MTAQAGVFKCKINGVTTYHHMPCGDKSSVVDIKVDTPEKALEREQLRNSEIQAHNAAEAREQAIIAENQSRYAAAQASANQDAALNGMNRKLNAIRNQQIQNNTNSDIRRIMSGRMY
jgi:hypothetical protein